ncbi:39S ribosomal protein L21, mitochondrial [Trichoplax sp. H2]|nr:39S ribosomal protein L21, mitochondrial [Trichoplax sp. H2]|eukprot:RDD45726.1 39S ribosomal protein L21, mitochondrial [Trichoplax sp. H2]
MLNLHRTLNHVWHKTIVNGCRHGEFFTQAMGYKMSNVLASMSHRFLSTAPQPESKLPQRETKKRYADIIKNVNEEIKNLPQTYAVVYVGGHQFKITRNDIIVINQIKAEVGSDIILEKVLAAGSKNFTLIGRPLISNKIVKVSATVAEHTKTPKITVFKKKRRKNYKRTKGHRQNVTVLRINDIELRSELS